MRCRGAYIDDGRPLKLPMILIEFGGHHHHRLLDVCPRHMLHTETLHYLLQRLLGMVQGGGILLAELP